MFRRRFLQILSLATATSAAAQATHVAQALSRSSPSREPLFETFLHPPRKGRLLSGSQTEAQPQVGDTLTLSRGPVWLYTPGVSLHLEGATVGVIPHHYTETLFTLLDQGHQIEARIIEIQPDPPHRDRLKVRLELVS